MRKENPRRDIVSRTSFPKGELFRIACKDGLSLDLEGTLGGRAIYIHKDAASLKAAQSRHLLARYAKGKDLAPLFEAMEKAL